MAALATGLSARCVDEASKYALERKTFGQPIANHQVGASCSYGIFTSASRKSFSGHY